MRLSTRHRRSAVTWRRWSGRTSTSWCGTLGARKRCGQPGTRTIVTLSLLSWLWTPQTGRGCPSLKRNSVKCWTMRTSEKQPYWYLPTSRMWKARCLQPRYLSISISLPSRTTPGTYKVVALWPEKGCIKAWNGSLANWRVGDLSMT